MEKVRFTVAISAYNIENYVKRAIDSVLNQTFKNYELLVIDDCSTDSTVEVIKQVVGQNAKILQTKKNSGTAAASRNIAIENAQGEYLLFLDGDDDLYSNETLKEIDEQNSSEENEENKVQEILKYEDGQEVRIAGIITSVKKKYTKNNKIMAFVTIEDLNGSVEIIIFEPTFLKYQDKLLEENIIMIKGRLSIREDDNTKIVAQEIRNFGEKFSENSNKYENKKQNVQNTEIQKPKHLVIDITNMEETEKAKLRGAIRFFNGERNNIPVAVKTGDEIKPCGAIHLTEEILKEFEEIAGKQNVGIDLY